MKFLDVVKWRNPQNWAENEDIMVVQETTGSYVDVYHVLEDGYGNKSTEKMEDLRVVGRCTAYEQASEIYKRYLKA